MTDIIKGLTVGRIVHVRQGPECRAAMVVRVWNAQTGCSNLTVFTDWSNDASYASPSGSGMRWETSVLHTSFAGANYGWHWPQDCANAPGVAGAATSGAAS